MRGREGEEDQARVGQVQNPLVPHPGQIEGGVPGALDAGDHVQEDGEQYSSSMMLAGSPQPVRCRRLRGSRSR